MTGGEASIPQRSIGASDFQSASSADTRLTSLNRKRRLLINVYQSMPFACARLVAGDFPGPSIVCILDCDRSSAVVLPQVLRQDTIVILN